MYEKGLELDLMDNTAKRDRPRTVTSRRSIKYRKSGWRVHEFEVWSGEMVCRCAALRMQDSLLLWLGGAGEGPALAQAALGAPGAGATALLGEGSDAASGLARRLAAALGRPVLVCCGAAASLDRFTMPLVERALVAEIKRRPDCF